MVLKHLALAVFLALALGTRAAGAEPLGVEKAQIWKADSATTVIFVEDHRAPLVEIRLVFPQGKWSPWMRRVPRVADLFELQNMDPNGLLRGRGDRLGADVVLMSDARLSELSLGCRKPDLDSVADLARAILTNRDLDRREIRRQALQKKFEWSASEKDPNFVRWQAALRTLFAPGDPRRDQYEPPPRSSGDYDLLVAMRDTLVRLPGRVIGLAGDLTRGEAEGLASGLLPVALASARASSAPNLPPIVEAPARPREKTIRLDHLTQAYLALSRDAPGLDDPDYPAFSIANQVLAGNYLESRLYQAVRLKSGDVYGAGANHITEAGPNVYAIVASTRASNGPSVEVKLRKALSDLCAGGISEQERSDAVGYMKGQRLFSLQEPGKVLDGIIRDRSRGLPPDYRASLLARQKSLTLAEINAFIRRFYDPGAFTLVRVQGVVP